MDDNGLLGRLWSFLSVQLAAWAIFLLNAVAWFKVRNERLRDVATEKSADWLRLREERDRLQTRVGELEARNAELASENIELEGRAVKAEATLQGWSEARQMLAIEDATERVENRGNGNGGGE